MSGGAKGCMKLMYRPGAFRGTPCGKKVTGEHGFCAIHSPEAVAKREALRRSRYENEMAHIQKKCAEAKERERKLEVFPELLAALKSIVAGDGETGGTCEWCCQYDEQGHAPECPIAIALPAIAKAEGRS